MGEPSLDHNTPALAEYAARRDELLGKIAEGLQADPRFAAAWLAGSLGRGAGDALSDLDLWLVVEDSAEELLAQERMVSAGAPAARLALFRAFGEPLNIHENHHNAPAGGSFSAVLYRDPPVMVDWVLVPRSTALRPADTRLLFARSAVPEGQLAPQGNTGQEEPQDPESVRFERLAFFWMMAAVAAKYVSRLRLAEAQPERENAARQAVEWVLPFLGEICASVTGMPPELPETLTPAGHLRLLCDAVELRMGERAPARAVVETILALAGG